MTTACPEAGKLKCVKQKTKKKRAIEVSHIACKYEFRQNLRSHSWSVFFFYNAGCAIADAIHASAKIIKKCNKESAYDVPLPCWYVHTSHYSRLKNTTVYTACHPEKTTM